MRKFGVLTGGGDAPGLNAVIRAAVKTGLSYGDTEIIGIRDGFDGLLEPNGTRGLDYAAVRGILPQGGTILGTASRGNPFAREVVQDGRTVVKDVSGDVIARVDELELDALIVIGGDGTLNIGLELHELGCPVIGVPKTIDNDVGGTDVTFGFDTAVNTASEAIDRLHTTAASHHRVIAVELMGRDAGFIALHAGVSGGADVILLPELPFRYESLCQKVLDRQARGRSFSIFAVAEGAHPAGGEQVLKAKGDETRQARLGGIGAEVAEYVMENCGIEARVVVLGHLQRGGSPTAFDRWLGTRYGGAAVRLARREGFGRMVSLRGREIVDVELRAALAEPRRVDLESDGVITARQMGISFGD